MTTTEAPEQQSAALDDLTGWVDALKAAQRKIAELKELEALARKHIEERLGGLEVGTVAGRPVVRWTTVNSSRVDITKLRQLYPDLAEEVTVPSITRRFTLVKDGDES